MENFFLNSRQYGNINFELAERLQCSDSDKEECLETMDFILEMASQARNHGLLCLENYIDRTDSYLLRKAISYAIDGIDPDVTIKILNTCVMSGNFKGKELMKSMLIIDGVLSIQAGVNSLVLRDMLSAYFVADFQNKLMKDEENEENGVQHYITECEGKEPLDANTAILEEFDTKLDDRSFQRLLREIDNVDLVVGMYGASGKFQKRVLQNISKRLARVLVNELRGIIDVDISDICDSQKRVVYIILKLIESGEILLST